jgi:hypothetical protein
MSARSLRLKGNTEITPPGNRPFRYSCEPNKYHAWVKASVVLVGATSRLVASNGK